MNHSILREKSFHFAVRIARFCKKLKKTYREFEISPQLFRSGTAPGALCREAQYAESRLDFKHKLTIGLKEANEAEHWLDIIIETIPELNVEALSLKMDCKEIVAILVSSTKTLKNNPK